MKTALWKRDPTEQAKTKTQRAKTQRAKTAKSLCPMTPQKKNIAPRVASTRDENFVESALQTPRGARRFVVAAAAGRGDATRKYFADAALSGVLQVVENRGDDALQACDAAIVKSGTSTLQAAVMGAPQVVVYDVPPSLRAQGKWLGVWTARVPFVAMPNITLQRKIVLELLGEKCSAKNIAAEIERLLQPENAAHLRREYSQVRAALGADLPLGATERTAQILEEMLQRAVPNGTDEP